MVNNRFDYNTLDDKNKELYNYFKLSKLLMENGYTPTSLLTTDIKGADFFAIRNNKVIQIQLKSRMTINSPKYGDNKDLYMAFPDTNGNFYLIKHTELIDIVFNHSLRKKKSNWKNTVDQHWPEIPQIYLPHLKNYILC